jgi:hypothetical protein
VNSFVRSALRDAIRSTSRDRSLRATRGVVRGLHDYFGRQMIQADARSHPEFRAGELLRTDQELRVVEAN